MECFVVDKSDVNLEAMDLLLRGDEARHAARVLRLKIGDQFLATDLQGVCYKGSTTSIDSPSKNEWVLVGKIVEVLPKHNEPSLNLMLIQGITLGQSKFEEIAEKATEIGLSEIIPMYSKRTEKRTVNAERIRRIIQTACKQSFRATEPQLHSPLSLGASLELAKNQGRKIILLHESAPLQDTLPYFLQGKQYSSLALVIGPEGGFDEAEVLLATAEFGAQVASLGSRRLRAETAAIVAVSIAMSYE
ncbi:MAG: RsmE family RNA methyltransferase [bacterium]